MRNSQMTLDDDRVQALDHAVPTNPGLGDDLNSAGKGICGGIHQADGAGSAFKNS